MTKDTYKLGMMAWVTPTGKEPRPPGVLAEGLENAEW